MKKQSRALRRFIRIVFVRRMVVQIWDTYQDEKHARKLRFHGSRLAMMICIKIRRKIRGHGTLDDRFRNYIRDAVTLSASMMVPKVQDMELKKVMEYFFFGKLEIDRLIGAGRKYYGIIEHLQHKFKAGMDTKEVKLEQL